MTDFFKSAFGLFGTNSNGIATAGSSNDISTSNNNNNSSNDPIYLFLLSIELHSYLPVSRLKLSSTFSKKKKMFQGVCRINENFILNTQFNKKIYLHEI